MSAEAVEVVTTAFICFATGLGAGLVAKFLKQVMEKI